MRATSGPPVPLPLTVVTGFLGAGKTTLLNGLLRSPDLADAAVLINEVGEIGIDHLLVQTVADGVILLATGCVCCTIRGELVAALEDLTRARDNGRISFARVIVETTGLADPAPVLHTIMAHPYLLLRYRLDGVVTLVDARNGLSTLDRHRESVKQVAVADRLVVTKTDLLTPADAPLHAALRARLRALNPAAPIVDAAQGEATPERLLHCGLYAPESKHPDVRRWLAEEALAGAGAAHGAHDDRIRTLAFATDHAISASAFDLFLELLRALHGPNLLRLKGIVKIAEQPQTPMVIHGVQHVFHPPVALPFWPDGDQRTRIVAITQDMDPATLEAMFQAFCGVPAPDRPDAGALTDNPLVPFGGADR